MHETSRLKMECFRDEYLHRVAEPLRVLDIGSMSYDTHASHRPLFPSPGFDYVGMDIAPGPNVDFVPADPYSWAELDSRSFDTVISGQVFEHNPYFWLTAAEAARVLKPGGLFAVVAPSAGKVHRYPFDCWRFYPDSGPALFSYVGLEPVEAFVERYSPRTAFDGVAWRDMLAVGRRPTGGDQNAFEDRLAAITATRAGVEMPPLVAPGPASGAYERRAKGSPAQILRFRAGRIWLFPTRVKLAVERRRQNPL